MKLCPKRTAYILKYMPYANRQACLFVNKYNIAYMLEDFQSVAYEGLCKAARKYDAKSNIAFGQFIPIYVIGSLMDEFRKMDILSRSERKQRIQGDSIMDIILVDIDEPLEIGNLKDVIRNSEIDIDCFYDKQEAVALLCKAIKRLPLPEQLVFCLYSCNKYTTYNDIGYILNYSPSRVCQLLRKAKETLKEKVKWEEN